MSHSSNTTDTETTALKNFSVVRSSAGSGKTYTLVRKYLLMILQYKNPSYFNKILAITFTNKATGEMKSRIMEALEGLAANNSKFSDLKEDLARTLAIDFEEITKRSSKILHHLLHHYSDFSISTIDRFVSRIIKSFSFELNIPAGFEIELDKDRIIQKSIDLFLSKLGDDNYLEKLMVEFASHKFMSDKAYNIEGDLKEMAEEMNKPVSKYYLNQLHKLKSDEFIKIRSELFKRIAEIEIIIGNSARKIVGKLSALSLEESDLAGGSKGVFSFLTKLSKKPFELKEANATVKKILEGGVWSSGKIQHHKKQELDANSDSLTGDLSDLTKLIEENWQHYHFCKLMSMRIDLISLFTIIYNELSIYKKNYNILQLDDFNELISDIIDESPVPYLYERTGEKYNHYLIDEFQDTSQIQWYNLVPLIENSLSEGYESLIVGDEKQAIYRFRGGDVQQMSRLPELKFEFKDLNKISSREKMLKSVFNSTVLQYNYRSTAAVVNFVNNFFSIITDEFQHIVSDIYKDHKQLVKSKDQQGSVRVKFLPEKSDVAFRLDEIVAEVNKFISIGYKAGDISILCRKKKQCSSVAAQLMKLNFPVISAESLKLSSSEEVSFLIRWMQYFHVSYKRDIEFMILHYLSIKGKNVAFDYDVMLNAREEDVDFKLIFSEYYPECNLNELSSLSIHELLVFMAATFIDNYTSDPYVLNLIDQTLKFQEQNGNDRAEFLKWWEEKGINLDIELPETKNSIRILTIHKAKGLEFNIVILPFMNDKIEPGEEHVWVKTKGRDAEIIPEAWLPVNKTLLETAYKEDYEAEMSRSFIDSLNLMYVGMTRAAHHLSILSVNKNNKENIWTEDNLLWRCFKLKDYTGSEENAEFFTGKLDLPSSERIHSHELSKELGPGQKNNWRDKIHLKYRSDSNLLSGKEFTPQEFGNLLHEILSKISYLDEIRTVTDIYRMHGILDEDDVPGIVSIIEGTFEQTELKDVFNDKSYRIYNERDFISETGEVYRPDRMMIRNNDLVLIDYKTGQKSDSHKLQLHTYIDCLKKIGNFNISAFIVYFSSMEIEKVT